MFRTALHPLCVRPRPREVRRGDGGGARGAGARGPPPVRGGAAPLQRHVRLHAAQQREYKLGDRQRKCWAG